MSQVLIIGTRGSQLARVQAEYVAATLRQHHPALMVELRIISTKGDRILDVALSAVGDKGLFVKEIEVALLQHEADLAVHSGKDLPSITPSELVIGAFPRRVDPRDALVLPDSFIEPLSPLDDPLSILPRGARVGTSSLRRACQVRAVRPDLELLDVRGNVETRLRKLDSGDYDALILAAAGLTRLGLQQRISLYIPADMLLPAVAQGALALEARADDTTTLERMAVLDDAETRVAVLAERAFLRKLEGGCQVPIAAYGELIPAQDRKGTVLRLRGLVGSLDGTIMLRDELTGAADQAEQLGDHLAERLLDRGAADLVGAIKTNHTGVALPAEQALLHGWRVVVTRSEEQADGLSQLLREHGAEPVAYPTIAFAPPDDTGPLDTALQQLAQGGYDWLVLTSANGVRFVQERLTALGLSLNNEMKLAAVGPTTAAACAELLNRTATTVPDKFVAEALAEALGNLAGQRVLIASADLARPVLEQMLQAAGAEVDRVIAYHTVPASGGVDLPGMLKDGRINAITFTSGSSVTYFIERVGNDLLDQVRQTVIACIGPITAKTAEEANLTPTVVATTSTAEGLVQALVDWQTRRNV
ncbi:MAG: hydroxymethylbilane synthase [Chloroflexaceae bacterium]|nr:hydroxymethylbilane synthase [Chloroflexaceae bacterium]